MNWLTQAALAGLIVACGIPSKAIEIEIEFLNDPFFSQSAVARAAIEAAADHVGAAITSSLTPIDRVSFSATRGATTARLDWTFAFRDQTTDEPIGAFPTALPDPNLAADTVRIFVDAQPLIGDDVGLGVPSGAEANIGASFTPPLNAGAIQDVAGLADGDMNRGGQGPLIGLLFEGPDNLNGNIDVDPVRFRSSFGGIAFDNDTNDNSLLDSTQQLEDFWHLDHTTAVDPQKIDLFSVAVSEIVTALGFGTSDTFEGLASDTDWAGAEVAKNRGSGVGVLDPQEPRSILSGTLSRRISDGELQPAALDPDITAGVREELTALDLAFLRDIGWQTVDTVSLAGDYNADGRVDAADYTVWRDNFGAAPEALPNDSAGGPIGDPQYVAWVDQFAASPDASTAVPEPSTILLTLLVLGAGRPCFLTPDEEGHAEGDEGVEDLAA